jgi:hypothetical protein
VGEGHKGHSGKGGTVGNEIAVVAGKTMGLHHTVWTGGLIKMITGFSEKMGSWTFSITTANAGQKPGGVSGGIHLRTGTNSFGNSGMISFVTGKAEKGHGGMLNLTVGTNTPKGGVSNGGDILFTAGEADGTRGGSNVIGGDVIITAGLGSDRLKTEGGKGGNVSITGGRAEGGGRRRRPHLRAGRRGARQALLRQRRQHRADRRPRLRRLRRLLPARDGLLV